MEDHRGHHQDAELIRLCRSGDEVAWNTLIHSHSNLIYHIAFNMTNSHADAAELTQETFLQAYANRSRIDPDKNVKSWLCSFTTNLCLNLLRKKDRKMVSLEQSDDTNISININVNVKDKLISLDTSPEHFAQDSELLAFINHAIADLPPQQHAVAILSFIHEFTHQEIAETLRIYPDTVKSNIRHARATLTDRIKKYLEN